MPRSLVACIAGILIAGTAIARSSGDAETGQARSLQDDRVQLGQALFFDRALSVDGGVSCASCHDKERAFADARATSVGASKVALTRNAPSLLDVKDRPVLFWDGRSPSLEQQVASPLLNPLEHGLADEQAVLVILRRSPNYASEFARAFPEEATPLSLKTVSAAIAAYERTLATPESALDRYLGGAAASGLSQAALRGWQTFRGNAHCTQCHAAEGQRPALTDDAFHSSPLGLGDAVTAQLPALIERIAAARASADPDAVGKLISRDRDVASLGRFVVSFDPRDIGVFRTPSLRGVALTAPYMHDGSVATLEQAVDLELYRDDGPLRKPITLSAQETADLVTFLRESSTPLAAR